MFIYRKYVKNDYLVSPKNDYKCKRITSQNIKKFGYNSISELHIHYPEFPTQCLSLNKKLRHINKLKQSPNGKSCKTCNSILRFDQRNYTFCSKQCYHKSRIKQTNQKIKKLCKVCSEPTHSGELHTKCKTTKCISCNQLISVRNKTKMCKKCYIHSDIANESRGKTFSKNRGYFQYNDDIFYYMSKLELRFLQYCKNLNIKVTKPKSMEYILNEKIHYYFPDYEVNGIIYEIKGYLTEEDKIKMSFFPNIKLLYSKDILDLEKGISKL